MLRERLVRAVRSRDMIVFLKFCSSGLLTATCSYAICIGLINAGAEAIVAGAGGYLGSLPVGFMLHRLFSFGSRNAVQNDVWRFCLVSLASALLAGWILETAVTAWSLPIWAGLLAAAAVVLPANFTAMKVWVFLGREPGKSSKSQKLNDA